MVLRPERRSELLPQATLQRLVATGQVLPDDLVWQQGWPNWVPVRDVAVLGRAGERQDGQAASPKPSVKSRLVHELRAYVGITLYIWLVMVLLRLHEALIAMDFSFPLVNHGYLIVKALILGKVVLIGEMMGVGERNNRLGRNWRIAYRAFLMALLLSAFHAIELVVEAAWEGRPSLSALDTSPHDALKFVVRLGLMTLSLVPYLALKELQKSAQRGEGEAGHASHRP
jgi:hypothetical protein